MVCSGPFTLLHLFCSPLEIIIWEIWASLWPLASSTEYATLQMLNDVFAEQMAGEEENAHEDLLTGMLAA